MSDYTMLRFGYDNVGDYNKGDKNTGCMNGGDWNTGDWNTGLKNSGCRNEGDWNTGDFNEGSFCSGDWNLADNSAGVFCCDTRHIHIFDSPTQLTLEDWRSSPACKILSRVRTCYWNSAERSLHTNSLREGCERLWRSLKEEERIVILKMPNFDAAKFRRITGIDIAKR